MGSELGEQFFRLVNECFHLRLKWRDFVSLFGTNDRRIDLINEAAGSFFGRLQDSLWEDALLTISRLTDRPTIAGKDTLTVQRLPLLVEARLRGRVKTLLQECLQKCSFARDWRNRSIAHRELTLAIQDPSAQPLAPGSRQTVREAVESIEALLNAVESHYLRSEIGFEHTVSVGDAESLLYVIRDGVEAARSRHERLVSGRATLADLQRREI
jgi:hypothetical protein